MVKSKKKSVGLKQKDFSKMFKPVRFSFDLNKRFSSNGRKEGEKLEEEVENEEARNNFQDFAEFKLTGGFSHLNTSLSSPDNNQRTENVEQVAEREEGRGIDRREERTESNLTSSRQTPYESIRYDSGYNTINHSERAMENMDEAILKVSRTKREQFRSDSPEFQREINTEFTQRKMMDTSIGRFSPSEEEMYIRAPGKKEYETGLPFEQKTEKRRKF